MINPSFQIPPIWRNEKIRIWRELKRFQLFLDLFFLIISINLNNGRLLDIPSFHSPSLNEFLSKRTINLREDTQILLIPSKSGRNEGRRQEENKKKIMKVKK